MEWPAPEILLVFCGDNGSPLSCLPPTLQDSECQGQLD